MARKTKTQIAAEAMWPEGTKTCPRCGETKAHDLFASNRSAKRGSFSICKACEKADRIKAKKRKAAAAAEAAKVAKPKRTRKAPTA